MEEKVSFPIHSSEEEERPFIEAKEGGLQGGKRSVVEKKKKGAVLLSLLWIGVKKVNRKRDGSGNLQLTERPRKLVREGGGEKGRRDPKGKKACFFH